MRARQIVALTSIRGVAAWWVVIYHFRESFAAFVPTPVLGLVAHGYLAVDLFFELSGFVIALNYAAHFRQLDLPAFGRFLRLRLARIYPLHLFMLAAFLLTPLALAVLGKVPPSRDYEPGYFIMSIFMVQNWGFAGRLAWNVPAWSISTEWFVYLLFPCLAWGSQRWLRRTGAVLATLAGLLATFAVAEAVTGLSLGADIARLGLLRCVFEFSIGVLVFRLRASRVATGTTESDLSVMAACVCCAAYVVLPVPDYAVMPAGFCCLIYGLSDPRGRVARALSNRTLEWLGAMSYSTYLCHYLIKTWTKFVFVRPDISPAVPMVVYLAAVLAASVLLYTYCEVPGRRLLLSGFGRTAQPAGVR